MSFNIKQSFCYITKDRDWIKKLAGFSFSATLSMVLLSIAEFMYCRKIAAADENSLNWAHIYIVFAVFLVLTLFMVAIYFAYCTLNANRRIYKPDAPLYEWTKNVKPVIITSLVLLLSYVILFSAAAIFMFLIVYVGFKSGNGIIALASILFSVLFTVVFTVMFKILYLSYTVDLKPSSFFNFQRIKKMLSGNNLGNYFLYIGICFIMQLLFSFINAVTTGIGAIVTFPYSIYILSDLDAQFIRQAFEIDDKV